MTKAKKTSSNKKTGSSRKKRAEGQFSELIKYRDQIIVLDTDSSFLYIGKFKDANDYFITLTDADVHDRRESPSLNEKYIIESKRFGVRVNRRLVHIRTGEVISLSLLEDVIEY